MDIIKNLLYSVGDYLFSRFDYQYWHKIKNRIIQSALTILPTLPLASMLIINLNIPPIVPRLIIYIQLTFH